MITLYVIVEGQPEQGFVQSVLGEYLKLFGVFAKPILVGKKVKRDQATALGGVVSYQAVHRHVTLTLREHSRAHERVTTMMDLSAIPANFPGYVEAREISSGNERVRRLESEFYNEVGDPRFIPYIQLYECEALLFSDTSAFARFFVDPDKYAGAIAELGRIRDNHESPEAIDDDPSTAPSKRIISHIPEYRREKRIAGVNIAKAIGMNILMQECKHFGEWVSTLSQLST